MAKKTQATEEVVEQVVEETTVEATEEITDTTDATEVVVAEEVEEGEKKHKNRESTSEKAKKAAAARAAAGISHPGEKIVLDPLRLRGKKYRAVVSLVDSTKLYALEEAIELVKTTSTSSFKGSIDAHIKVKGDAIRGTVVLPSGSGKTKKVAVADEETIEAIAAGKLDFDVLIATPAQMPKLAKFAKVLGPKGLMPSPKAGTVTDDIEKVKNEIGGGRIEYRADKTGVIHLSIGRAEFTTEQLVANFGAIMAVLSSAKILSISLAPTMGPGVKVQITK